MQKIPNSDVFSHRPLSDRRLTEIEYHKKLNRRIVYWVCPVFVGFLLFYLIIGDYLQASIFFVLLLNAIIAVFIGFRINDLDKLVLSKQISSAIAFVLLGISVLLALMLDNIYVAYPWIFLYPLGAILFFGEKPGLAFCIVFYLITMVVLFTVKFPVWSASSLWLFRLSSAIALLSIIGISFISERTRVRMRNMLIRARNKYKEAEEIQRDTNDELKSEINLRIQSEQALLESEVRYRILFEESTVSLWEENYAKVKKLLDDLPMEFTDDLAGYFDQHPQVLEDCLSDIWVTAVNRATLKLYGAASKKELIENIWLILPPNALKYMTERLVSLYRTGHYNAQVTGQTLTGTKLHLLVDSTVPAGYESNWEKVFSSIYDITEKVAMEQEKKRVEKQLDHTRQIQAVASLAGGIAHQFNNSLAIIMGNLDLLELNVPESAQNGRFIFGLRAASNRIGKLTDQLLAYARGGKYQPKDFMVKALIEDFLPECKALQDASIEMISHFDPDVSVAGGDITQIRSVMEAVLLNAVEAMEDGGKITITATTQTIEEDHVTLDSALKPGRYAVITVQDQGVGMDEETCRRIFEPFFSTKFLGRGLGMAAAYGIIKNHDGTIVVQSRQCEGTCVTIYLPSATRPNDSDMSDSSRQAA